MQPKPTTFHSSVWHRQESPEPTRMLLLIAMVVWLQHWFRYHFATCTQPLKWSTEMMSKTSFDWFTKVYWKSKKTTISPIFHNILKRKIFLRSYFPPFATIFFMKVFFSKGWQELPLVALPAQEKIAFPFKRISATVGAKQAVFQKKVCF